MIGNDIETSLMIIFRMFCPLHTPAEEHQCDFDYQVSTIYDELW